jgi:hypothetical protein
VRVADSPHARHHVTPAPLTITATPLSGWHVTLWGAHHSDRIDLRYRG